MKTQKIIEIQQKWDNSNPREPLTISIYPKFKPIKLLENEGPKKPNFIFQLKNQEKIHKFDVYQKKHTR